MDREKLRSVAERIQVGDTDEGADALVELIDHAWQQGRANVRQEMHAEMQNQRLRAEGEKAVNKFAAKYPQLKDDPVLVDAAQRVLRNEMAADLRGAGMSEQELAPFENDSNGLALIHEQKRIRGLPLRDPEQLLDATGAVLSEKFNIRPRRNEEESRTAYVKSLRDARGLPDREMREGPTRADGRGRASDDFGSLEARREKVRAMREARGFPVNR